MYPHDRTHQPGFAILPAGLLTIWPHLKDSHRRILPALLSHMNRRGEAWPSQRRIAEKCGFSVRYANKLLGELHRLGIVNKQRRPSAKHSGDDTCMYMLADVDDETIAKQLIERCKRPLSRLPDRPVQHAGGADMTPYGCGFSEDVEELPSLDLEDDSDNDLMANEPADMVKVASDIDHCSYPLGTSEFIPPVNSPVPTPYALGSSYKQTTEQTMEQIKEILPGATPAGRPLGITSSESEGLGLPLGSAKVCLSNNQPSQPSEPKPSEPRPSIPQPSISQPSVQQPRSIEEALGSSSSNVTLVGQFPDFPPGLPGQPDVHAGYIPLNPVAQSAYGTPSSGQSAFTQANVSLPPIEDRRRYWSQPPGLPPF